MDGLAFFLFIFFIIPTTVTIIIYNQLVRKRNWVRNSFKQIDIQLVRRHDLIPNLLETAKKYMSHEETIFIDVSKARSAAESAREKADSSNEQSLNTLFQLEDTLANAMGKFYAVSENYPTLKSDSIMQKLQQELVSTENRITYSRQSYNDCVMDYNNSIEEFPGSIIVPFFSFKKAVFANFISNPEQRNTPTIKFD